MIAEIQDEGTIFLFRPMDMEAEEWCDENISDDRQSFGKAIVIEHRYISEIAEGFRAAGGIIE